MATPPLPTSSFLLQGLWIPGTMDRVCLSRGDGENLELSIHQLLQVFGRELVDSLYLKGKAELLCDSQLWVLLVKDSAQPETDEPTEDTK